MVIDLSPWDVAISAALILVSAGISIALGLKMEKRLAYASIRTVVQLLLVGFVLQRVFEINTVIALLPVVLFMLVIAAHTASGRPAYRFRGMGMLSFSVMTVTSLGVTITATGLIIGVEPWFKPSYLIPLLGMVLGNTMNGVSLATDHFLESVREKGHEIEMELAMGATRWEAGRRPVAEAVRRGMIPIVNSMMVVGVVSLPGMMTGQILAGSDPTVAVKYQIMVMFLIAAGASMGAMGMVLLSYRKLFNSRHQLLGSRLTRR